MMKAQNFFRDSENTIRLASSGVNCYTVKPKYVEVDIMQELGGSFEPNVDYMADLSPYAVQIIKECLEDLNNYGEGYVFSLDQLRAVALQTNNISAVKKENIYYVRFK